MRRGKRVVKNKEQISYWLSFSDLMSSLVIMFLLISVYMLLDYKNAVNEVTSANQELLNTKHKLVQYTELNANIIQKLKKELGNKISIDNDTGTLVLDSELLFDVGKSELKPAGKDFLKKYMYGYFEVLFNDAEVRNNISQIIIEGFTDDQGTYEYGLNLSYNRALSVYYYMLNDNYFSPFHNNMKELIILTGRSEAGYLERRENESIDSWRKRNRRVEIKFDLKYREIYEQLKGYLDSGQV